MYEVIEVIYKSALVKWLIVEMPEKKYSHVPAEDEGEGEEGAEVAEGEDAPARKMILVEEEVKLDEDQQRHKHI